MKKNDDMILSTASSIEGYKIVAQCGLVFGETVFKHGFLSRLAASVSNTVDTFAFGSREMSGSMGLIEEARDYAYDKMIRQAKDLGANAIIGIDSDNTIGGDIMYISLYGTAVRAVSEKDLEAQIVAEREAAAQREAEKERQAQDRRQRLDELSKRRAAGNYAAEEKLLSEIAGCDSVMQIWKIWLESGLDVKYPDITKRIKSSKESERMYGKMAGEAKAINKMINAAIFEE